MLNLPSSLPSAAPDKTSAGAAISEGALKKEYNMIHCFYHSADLDGHCSGAIVRRAYPEAVMHPINYGEPFPWDQIGPDEKVVMVDFSLQPFEEMVRLFLEVGHMVWIDHHASAIKDFTSSKYNISEDAVEYVLDDKKAACELAWRHFFPDIPMPTGVHLLGRYDVWDHKEKGVLPFQMGLRTCCTDPIEVGAKEIVWKKIFNGDIEYLDGILHRGSVILTYQRQTDTEAARRGFETDLDGLRCWAVNQGRANSNHFRDKAVAMGCDAVLSFQWFNGSWTVSLYSARDEVDVSSIAKARGGGGHQGASGFQCENLPFDLG